jgi:endo-1,3-1,4-beta-glycanase ExoK
MNIFKRLWEKIMRRRKPKPPVIIPPPPPPVGTPTVYETFASGVVPPGWTVSTWSAPQGGRFMANMATFDKGMLCLALDQIRNPDNSISSVGGEITYNTLCGFGTYEWVAKASSSSNDPNVPGVPLSGSVTGLFNFVNESETEIDLEVEGCRPTILHTTNWNTTAGNQTTQTTHSENLNNQFHSYKFVWKSGIIQFYFDGVLVATHTNRVPSAPAYPMINHWGTNNPNWGGLASTTVGRRYLFVKSFSFTPL